MLKRAAMINSRSLRRRLRCSHIRVCFRDLTVSQVKPLTEEEKVQRLAELRERMALKRSVKAVEEAKETKANEAIRRKAGRVSYCALGIDICSVIVL